jgi:hypothetical protein
LVYVLEITLFSPTEYHQYKLLPFSVAVQKEEAIYSYMNFNKEFIFSDPLRQHYGKMTSNELTGCPKCYIFIDSGVARSGPETSSPPPP